MGTFLDQQTISTYWLNKSEDLRRAAFCLWEASEESGVRKRKRKQSLGSPSRSTYFMLCGMSLEAILKGIILEKNQPIPKTHNLVALAKQAGVAYDAHETDLLGILSAAIIWDGRYPVPLVQDEWDRLIKLEGSKLFDSVPLGEDSEFTIATPNDELNWERFDKLWRRASDLLFSIARWVMRPRKK